MKRPYRTFIYALLATVLCCTLPNNATSSKRQLLQNICCGIGCLGNITSQGFNCVCIKLNEIIALLKVSEHCATIVYPSNFGTTGYTITQPGYYILCGDVPFAPSATNALTIASSYVTFDMNEHAIYQTNATASVNGAVIYKANTSLHDIEIKNGNLANFTQYGIYVDPTAAYPYYNIRLENLSTENTGNRGINFYGKSNAKVTDCTISNCLATKSSASALGLTYCSDIIIKDSQFTNSTSLGGNLQYLSKCNFINCAFNNNEIGVALYNTNSSLLFEACTFNNNEIGGLISDNRLDCSIIRNCTILNTTLAARGIYLIGDGTFIESCLISSNGGGSFEYYGINLEDCIGCEVRDCTILANNGNLECYGIYLDGGQGNNVINCTTKENNATTAEEGIGIYIDSTNAHIEGCSSFSNSGRGIYNIGLNSIITGCVAGNNGTTNYYGVNLPVDINPLGANVIVYKFANVALQVNPIP